MSVKIYKEFPGQNSIFFSELILICFRNMYKYNDVELSSSWLHALWSENNKNRNYLISLKKIIASTIPQVEYRL